MKKSEFERLQPGQMIQHKKNNEWAFIVQQNFGDRLTAVRTIEVRDPENWEAVTKDNQIEELKKALAVMTNTVVCYAGEVGHNRPDEIRADLDEACRLLDWPIQGDKRTIPAMTPPHENAAFKLAGRNLHDALKGASWYSCVGLGAYKLIIYTSKKKYPKPYDTFEGYPVEYKYMGKIKPA
jgi:hypothetical protein